MSTQRHCSVYLANNGKWYMELGVQEYDRQEDSTTYGPFASMDKVYDELRHHSNPGGSMEDRSGTREVPTVSPNGKPVQKPTMR